VNGYLITVVLTSGPSVAVGILAGRNLQHRDSYQSGLETGRMMATYQKQHPLSAADVLDRSRRRVGAGRRVGGHGHDGPCSPERGCY